ncbi:MAG: hypothetical protein ACP5OG_00080 [Candidatus Nanoarchaeia archaeon]
MSFKEFLDRDKKHSSLVFTFWKAKKKDELDYLIIDAGIGFISFAILFSILSLFFGDYLIGLFPLILFDSLIWLILGLLVIIFKSKIVSVIALLISMYYIILILSSNTISYMIIFYLALIYITIISLYSTFKINQRK